MKLRPGAPEASGLLLNTEPRNFADQLLMVTWPPR